MEYNSHFTNQTFSLLLYKFPSHLPPYTKFKILGLNFPLKSMSKENGRGLVSEKKKSNSPREKEKANHSLLSKHLKKVYPTGLPKTSSHLSLSSLSLSLSQSSNDSFTSSTSTLEQKISLALRLIAQSGRRQVSIPKSVQVCQSPGGEEGLKRCNWITKNSGKFYN